MLTKKCAQCSFWENHKDNEGYVEFMMKHESECLINHVGSAGKMECDGIVSCFESSIETHKLCYTEYLGDGDSKSYSFVVEKNPYPDKPVQKLECVGHIQTRVGARCRKMKQAGNFKNIYSEVLDSKKRKRKKMLRLTDKDINKLQNYFGIAIRDSNAKTVYELKKAIAAVLYHCSDAETIGKRHQFYPTIETTWCKYQLVLLKGHRFM